MQPTIVCRKCKKVGGVDHIGSEAWCCRICGYWENSFGEHGSIVKIERNMFEQNEEK